MLGIFSDNSGENEMKTLILSLYIFAAFKFAPKIIDNHSSKFWINNVTILNNLRKTNGDTFYFFKIGRLYIRDLYCFPMQSTWTSSNYHPFCWRKA
jgi:hypothetical protein